MSEENNDLARRSWAYITHLIPLDPLRNSREGEPQRVQDEQTQAHHCRRARGWRKPLHSFSLKSHSLFLATASYAWRSARASRVRSK